MLTLKIFGFNKETLQSPKFLIANMDVNEFIEDKVGPEAVFYQLKASVVHYGYSRGSGQYFAVIKHGEAWKKFSDTSLEDFSFQELKQ